MSLCKTTPVPPLACFAKGLDRSPACLQAPMKFPMYTMALEEFMKMKRLFPHETLMAEGLLVTFVRSMGQAAFVSHQWLSGDSPDPGFKQLAVLQDALRAFMTKDFRIQPLFFGQSFHFGARSLSTKVFQSKPLFLWYDYFSLPQLKTSTATWTLGDLAKPIDDAIESIPAYVSSCELFLVLCPPVYSAHGAQLFGQVSWRNRGWCRMEKTLRQLSEDEYSYTIIKGATSFEYVASQVGATLDGFPGEGAFGFSEDRNKLGLVLKTSLKRVIRHHLACGNFPAYRAFVALTNILLRGFSADCQASKMSEMTGWEGSLSGGSMAEEFLDQNGFSHINQVDEAGWSPICYAAVNGDPNLVENMLAMRADANAQARKAHPYVGNAPFISVVGLSAYFSQNEAVKALLAARANPEVGSFTAMSCAVSGNNALGTRMLCEAGCSLVKPFFGLSPLLLGAHFGCAGAVVELLKQDRGTVDLSKSLHVAVMRCGSPQMVSQLIDARADMNEQIRQPIMTVLGFLWFLARCKRRVSREAVGLELPHHIHKATPLMCAVLCCQVEAAAALLVRGAKVDVQNSRKAKAIDLAREVSAPSILLDALEGDSSAMEALEKMVQPSMQNRVVSLDS